MKMPNRTEIRETIRNLDGVNYTIILLNLADDTLMRKKDILHNDFCTETNFIYLLLFPVY